MKKFYGLLILCLVLVSCSDNFNVEYQICDVQYKNCVTKVKFEDFDSCQRYKEFNESYCDKVSTPGKMICDTRKKYEERLTSKCKEIK